MAPPGGAVPAPAAVGEPSGAATVGSDPPAAAAAGCQCDPPAAAAIPGGTDEESRESFA